MGVLQDINNELRSYLLVLSRIQALKGNLINVGEEFQVSFEIRNGAPADGPFVRFRDLFLRVDSAGYAKPRDAESGMLVVDLPVTTLDPGQSVGVDVFMVATGNMADGGFGGWLADLYMQEDVFRAWVAATVDTKLLFSVEKLTIGRHEIEPT